MQTKEVLEKTNSADFDVCDNVYDVMYTFCWDKEMFAAVEEYNIFCKELFKKTEVENFVSTDHVCLKLTDMIRANKSLFEEYMKNNWRCQYEEKDDFEYEWCKELLLFTCGYASESQYKSLREEVLEKIPV